jgi:hypothetical protein
MQAATRTGCWPRQAADRTQRAVFASRRGTAAPSISRGGAPSRLPAQPVSASNAFRDRPDHRHMIADQVRVSPPNFTPFSLSAPRQHSPVEQDQRPRDAAADAAALPGCQEAPAASRAGRSLRRAPDRCRERPFWFAAARFGSKCLRSGQRSRSNRSSGSPNRASRAVARFALHFATPPGLQGSSPARS